MGLDSWSPIASSIVANGGWEPYMGTDLRKLLNRDTKGPLISFSSMEKGFSILETETCIRAHM